MKTPLFTKITSARKIKIGPENLLKPPSLLHLLLSSGLTLVFPLFAHAQVTGGRAYSFGPIAIGVSSFRLISSLFIFLLFVGLLVYMIVTRKQTSAEAEKEPGYKRLALILAIFTVINVGIFYFFRFYILPVYETLSDAFYQIMAFSEYGSMIALWLLIAMVYILQFNGYGFKKTNLAVLFYLFIVSFLPFIPSVLGQFIVANLAYASSKAALQKGKDVQGYLKYSIIFLLLLFLITYVGVTANTHTTIAEGVYFNPSSILMLIGAPLVLSLFSQIYVFWLTYYFVFLYVFFFKRTTASVLAMLAVHFVLLLLLFLAAAGAAMG